MKACVVGIGDMGLAVAWALQQLGFELQLIEEDKTKFSKIKKVLGIKLKRPNYPEEMEPCDVVVSCLPYAYNYQVVDQIVDELKISIPYCDLGGSPKWSKHIQARGDKLPVFTDMGLAPGYINIMAEEIVRRHKPKKVVMQCGGLPTKKMKNALKYGLSFSAHGLMNEYSGMCDIIKDGAVAQVPALSGIERFVKLATTTEHYEAFFTRGAAQGSIDFMLEHGVENFWYKTIRYQGHARLIKFLMEDCKITKKKFLYAIKNACPKLGNKDKVMIKVSTDNFGEYITVLGDEHWSAMQKCTAFPTAAVAAIMAKDKTPKVWKYSDISVDEFKSNLMKICGSVDKYREDELIFEADHLQ